MMKKSLLYILLMMCIPYKIYAMEKLVQEVEQLASSPQAQAIEGKAIGFIQSPTGQNIIKEGEVFIESKVESIFSHSTATTATTTTASTTNVKTAKKAKTTTTPTTATTLTTTTTSTVPTIIVSDPAAQTVIAQNNATLNQLSSSVQPSQDLDNVQEDIPLSNNNQASRHQVPNLNLNSSTLPPMRLLSSSAPLKTPVKTVDQLTKGINKTKVQSARNNNGPSTRNTPSVSNNSQDVVINMASVQKSALSDDTELLSTNERTYTANEVWNMIQEVKPEVVEFAQENNLSLDQAILFGGLLKKFNVSPAAVVEYINKNKLPDDKKTVMTSAEYKKIQKEQPDQYKKIILEILKDISDEQEKEGQKTVSPLTDTHIDLLEGQVASDKNTKLYQWAALAVTLTTFLGSLGWAIYGQVKPVTNAPTMAPTFAPTFEPTMFPT
jgi:hypothetical protein